MNEDIRGDGKRFNMAKRDISEHIMPLEVSVFGEGEWQTESYTRGMEVKWKMGFKVVTMPPAAAQMMMKVVGFPFSVPISHKL